MAKPKPPEPVKQITVKAPVSVVESVDRLAAASGQSRSAYIVDLMRLAVGRKLVREWEDTPRFREDDARYGK